MMRLKLPKLPERVPVRVSISLTPELHRTLERYAECYRQTYGKVEKAIDLIPFMLDAFLTSDKEFSRLHKSASVGGAGSEGEVG